MKCAIKGCKNEVVEISGATGRLLCRVHLYGPGTKMQPAPENKMLTPDSNKAAETEPPEIEQVLSLTPAQEQAARALVAGGYYTAADVREASDEDLLEVSGIGPVTLALIREALG